MWKHFPATYPAKAAPPLSSSNIWLHSCRLSIAEKNGANDWQEQSKAPLTVQYEVHTSAQPIQQLGPICRTNNIAQQFSCLTLDNGTERGRKVVLDNLWRSHIDWHWLALIGIHSECRKQTTIAKTTVGNLVINWYLWIIYSWEEKWI
jgi:hypothetical protein